jgi:hypothetical protein
MNLQRSRGPSRRFIAAVVGCVLCWVVGRIVVPSVSHAQETAPEPEVKAAFVAKFAGFVKWPAGGGLTNTIGVAGDDAVGGALGGMAKVKKSKRPEDLKTCQIVFIPSSERANLGAILAGLAGTAVLTVSDIDGFAKQGGMIGFVKDGDKVRFEINNGVAKRAGLAIDVRLLKLAIRTYN